MQTFLYARVSTADQTIGHQRTQAEAAGYVFDHVVHDDGVSGVSTRFRDREGSARLLHPQTGLRRGDVLVTRWVDRLGRNYEDVTETIRTLMQRGVIIKTIINAMTFDGATEDPIQKAVRDALIGFMAATAQARAEATKEAQKAGIKAARDAADGATRYRGRKPTFDAEQLQRTHELLSMDWTPSAIAKEVGIPRATVYRIKEDPAKMVALLNSWAIA
jgi:putative DNA-invertase from lambdoid prophage Rac